ncbi:MAG: hypothetical protein JNN30_04075 [Rhodanobacteraceae bacterium]|nr:hypothetical protein [Rhodanobacteraceae bacterium]
MRRWLQTLGIDSRRIRTTVAPSARGSAEAFVITQYPLVVKEFRAKANHQLGIGMIVVVDADLRSVEYRCRQLDQSLENAGRPVRAATERICHLVPKRHIETWLRYLLGVDVDEERDIKHDFREVPPDLIRLAGERFGESRRAPQCLLASLVATIDETRRLGL